ncbi:MAG: hypothetical protein AAGD25_06160 [Cyanobacteria bacterium P01_F01_bin.150]
MVLILVVVIGLVSWALHLMQEAMDRNEFSLMLAGVLVSSAAAALVAVYLLMDDYVAYRANVVQYYNAYHQASEFYSEGVEGSYLIEHP